MAPSFSLADDLNFSAFGKKPIVGKLISEYEYSMKYEDALALAKETGKVIVITKDVVNQKEYAAMCERDGSLYVNGNGNPNFLVGLSKIEVIDGKAIYVELPSSAFPNRPQGVQYRINKDSKAAAVESFSFKVTVPTTYMDITLEEPRKLYNMDMTPYVGNGVVVNGGSCSTGNCPR